MPDEPNPFLKAAENRSVTMTFRITPTEHEAMKSVTNAGGRGEIVDLIREGVGIAIERRRTARAKGRKS